MTLDDLVAYGANTSEGLARCVGSESLYLELVDSVRTDERFEALQAAVQEGRLRDAFENAHALKGVLGNLSLTPLYDPMCEITELLRAETAMDYTDLMSTINAEYAKLCAL